MRADALTGTVVAMAILTMAAVSACRRETPQNPVTGAARPPAVPAESKPSTGISTLVDKLAITDPPAPSIIVWHTHRPRRSVDDCLGGAFTAPALPTSPTA